MDNEEKEIMGNEGDDLKTSQRRHLSCRDIDTSVSVIGARQRSGQRRKRISVDQVLVIFVLFAANLRVELFIWLEVFGQQKFRILGDEIFRQTGQTIHHETSRRLINWMETISVADTAVQRT